MGITNPLHLAFIALIALLFLGPKKLPDVARSIGAGMREFRDSLSGEGHDEPHTPIGPGEEPPVAAPPTYAAEHVEAEPVHSAHAGAGPEPGPVAQPAAGPEPGPVAHPAAGPEPTAAPPST